MTEHDFEMGVGSERPPTFGIEMAGEHTDVHAFVNRFEKTRECGGALPIGYLPRVCRHDEAIIGGVPRQCATKVGGSVSTRESARRTSSR
jgi:hypothetical protein